MGYLVNNAFKYYYQEVTMETYYNPEDLAKFGSVAGETPTTHAGEKFFEYYNSVFAEGALTAREKSLIALAVAHTVQCPYCIDAGELPTVISELPSLVAITILFLLIPKYTCPLCRSFSFLSRCIKAGVST